MENGIVWACDPKFLALRPEPSLSSYLTQRWAGGQKHRRSNIAFWNRFSSFALQGPLCFPKSTRDAWLPGDRCQATACTHTPGEARVLAIWRRTAPVRSPHPTCLPPRCRHQDRRPRHPPPRPRSQNHPWSRRRARWAQCLTRPAMRIRCPLPCFMGHWMLKTHSWSPVRRRSRSC